MKKEIINGYSFEYHSGNSQIYFTIQPLLKRTVSIKCETLSFYYYYYYYHYYYYYYYYYIILELGSKAIKRAVISNTCTYMYCSLIVDLVQASCYNFYNHVLNCRKVLFSSIFHAFHYNQTHENICNP